MVPFSFEKYASISTAVPNVPASMYEHRSDSSDETFPSSSEHMAMCCCDIYSSYLVKLSKQYSTSSEHLSRNFPCISLRYPYALSTSSCVNDARSFDELSKNENSTPS